MRYSGLLRSPHWCNDEFRSTETADTTMSTDILSYVLKSGESREQASELTVKRHQALLLLSDTVDRLSRRLATCRQGCSADAA